MFKLIYNKIKKFRVGYKLFHIIAGSFGVFIIIFCSFLVCQIVVYSLTFLSYSENNLLLNYSSCYGSLSLYQNIDLSFFLFNNNIFYPGFEMVFRSLSIFFFIFFIFLISLIGLLVAVAYYTLVERKLMGSIQHREGPGIVGFWGLLQPLADGLKLFIKEPFKPIYSQKFLFYIAPILALFLSILGWIGMHFSLAFSIIDLNILILFFFVISSFNVYSVVLAGWSSNSKYALLGSLRSTAQMISYEVSLGFVLILIAVYGGSLNLTDIIFTQRNVWFIFLMPFLCFMFYVSLVAETNRAPFDLPEAEAEIVAGYHVEYSGMGFSLFFLGEYSNMLLMSFLMVCFFFGGWDLPFCYNFFSYILDTFVLVLKSLIIAYSLIVARAAFPRYRYDKLMVLGWLVFLPLTFGLLFVHGSLLYFFECIPVTNDILLLNKVFISNF